MIILGIDPGKKGGIAYINNDNVYTTTLTKSNLSYITFCCTGSTESVVAYVEKVHSMPNQGVVSMFTFGEGYGYIKGVLDARRIRRVNVTPQQWKREFNLINEDKHASIIKAKELFPNVNLLASKRSRVESDGLAESLLIAEYGRRCENDNNGDSVE